MRTADFDFVLPPELIAQRPAPRRDESRLLVLNRAGVRIEHRRFREFPEFLRAGDVLALNNSRVIPARLRGANARTGGRFEILLLEQYAVNDWWAMLRPARRARVGAQIAIHDPKGNPAGIGAVVVETNDEGCRRLKFSGTPDIGGQLERLGETPLPPYIHRDHELPEDRERYQTVFAERDGSVAAPTAGLHFTPELLEQIRGRGVQVCFVTLHVGPGTFLPVKTDTLAAHKMHEERFEVGQQTARIVNEAKSSGRRVIAVGTTAVRVLESIAGQNHGKTAEYAGKTRIFIHPPFQFKTVDALLTNFHLPCSTLLMLASAFAAPGETRGREMMLAAYAEAIREHYRFYSYGDAMLIL
ncbi:MAG: tRNA preQ1(34) S-adenosylmethionine ribosyltransferase-isomerase QueA [Verrucomicrobiota bacterium]|jgi:S-adenosylmethionine:tRNA ribosyltransferase-isomerase